jgi:hypothetical protein
MSWTTPAELRQQVQKLWDKGAILASLASGQPLFPKRLTLKTPSSAELLERFDAARAWSQSLRDLPYVRLEMREFRHRVFGANCLPAEAWIDDLAAAVALIGKQKETRVFTDLLEQTDARQPPLRPWLVKRPLRVLELADAWPLLLKVVAWLCAHPRPDVYLRQIDVPGVHSKFVEAQRGVLSEMFDLALPPDAIDHTTSGVAQFARRYGFRDKPERIRLRVLDPACIPLPSLGAADITLDAASFSRLGRIAAQVFITENETNFLAFPAVKNSLVLFGAGYGFEALGQAGWLHDCRLHYWGDIDTHGFAILDQLRGQFAHVASFLMDRATLLACEPLWGVEDSQTTRDLARLTDDEHALYDELRDNRIRPKLRLEQERIGFGRVLSALSGLG